MYRTAPVFALVVVLGACVPQQQACVADATRQVRILDGLIGESEATLARGYALREQTSVRRGVTFCSGVGRSRLGRTTIGTGLSTCIGDRMVTRQVPVAVNLADVRQNLAELRQRRVVAARASQSRVAACGPV